MSANDIRTSTIRDHVLSRVSHFVLHGRPQSCDSEFRIFSSKRSELSVPMMGVFCRATE